MEGNRALKMKNSCYLDEDVEPWNRKYDYTKRLKPNEMNTKSLEFTNLNRCYRQNVKANQTQFSVTDTPKLAHCISQSDPVGLKHNHFVEKKPLTPSRRKPIKPVFFQREGTTSRAKEIKKPKISCSVPVINCIVGDKQLIHNRNCDVRNVNCDEDESFTDMIYHTPENIPGRPSKQNTLSKHKINTLEHRYADLEPRCRNISKRAGNEAEKVFIKPSSPDCTSSSECNFNFEEDTFAKGYHNASPEQKWRRNASRLQFYSKYNNLLSSRYYKTRYNRYHPVDYTSSTHPVSCSSDASLMDRNGFVRRRRRRFMYRKTRPKREVPQRVQIKKPLVSPLILKSTNICEIPENRHFEDGEKCRKNVVVQKSKNKFRDVNNNNITPNTQIHKELKPKVTEEDIWKRFHKLFRSYCSTKLHSGDLISPRISTCWMKNVGVVKDVLNNSEAETAFKKAAGQKITMNVHEYKDFLLSLTMRRKLPLYEIYRRMCGI